MRRCSITRGVGLLWRRYQRRVDDLTTHGEITPLLELAVKIGEQPVERAGLGELLPEQPDRSRIRRRPAKIGPKATPQRGGKPRKRSQLSRSRIRYSIRASLTLFCAAKISTLSIATGSYGGRPPFIPSE